MSDAKRTLRFPENIQCGRVMVIDDGQYIAHGEVEVPADKAVILEINRTLSDVSFLKNIEADALSELSLSGCAIGDMDAFSFAHFSRLESLNLANTSMSEIGMETLQGLPLKLLSLEYTRVRSLDWLKHFPGLVSLNLSKCVIDDEALTAIPKDCQLQFLYLKETKVSTSGILALKHLPLKHLYVDACKISAKLLEELAAFPDLCYLSAWKTDISDRIAAVMNKLGRQRTLPQPEPAFHTRQTGTLQAVGMSARDQIFEVVVRQALGGIPWREVCEGPMQIHGITAEEVEVEIARRQAWNQP